MELGRLRCGKGVSRALKNRRRASGETDGVSGVGHTARWRVYPPMPAAVRTGPQRGHECVRSQRVRRELDEATRSTRILASPISPGTHNRAEVATLLGQHVLVLLRLRRESVSTGRLAAA